MVGTGEPGPEGGGGGEAEAFGATDPAMPAAPEGARPTDAGVEPAGVGELAPEGPRLRLKELASGPDVALIEAEPVGSVVGPRS